MDVALVSTYEQPCGIATYTANLATALRKIGHRATILGEVTTPGQAKPFKDPNAYPVWRRGNTYESMFGLGRITQAITTSAKKPDVVHIQHEFGIFPVGIDLWRLVKDLAQHVRVFVTLHTAILPPKASAFFWKFNEAQCRFIVHTPSAMAALLTWQKNTSPKIFVVPHGTWVQGATSTELKQHARTVLQLPVDRLIALCPGFVTKNKGHETILRGLGHTPDTTLIIIGAYTDDLYVEKIRMWMAVFGVEDRIELRFGFQPAEKMDLYYKAADYVILGSTETTPFSASGQLHTAAGYGLPILARDVPIYRESPAILYQAGEEELEDEMSCGTLMQAFQNLQLRQEAGRAALSFAQSRAWEKVAAEHIEVYQS